MYVAGKGVPEDFTKAAEMFRKAAEGGLASAQVYLGSMYRYGKGVPRDSELAAIWAPTRGIPTEKTISGTCTSVARGCPATTGKQQNGSKRRRNRITLPENSTWDGDTKMDGVFDWTMSRRTSGIA
jgi:hypothetical protein